MYEKFWGLERRPFDCSTLPEFYFAGETHQAALLKLRYAVENRLGAGLLVGGIGSGKTYLAGVLLHELADRYRPVIQMVFPQLTSAEFLAYLALELGAEEAALGTVRSADHSLRLIEQQLRHHTEEGRRPTILIDEAHLIEETRVFQMLQLLLNLQQQSRYDFTLILAGERSLAGRLARVSQLDERIGVRACLDALSLKETAAYIEHRLEIAGASRTIFAESALKAIFELSSGLPRRINRLGDLALVVGYAEGLKTISATEISAVAEELPSAVAA